MARGGPTIVVVDDEEDVLESVQEFLAGEMPEARILTAESGRSAVALLGREAVAVVLSDVRMPGMDGIELMEEVARRNPETARVLMTAFIDPAMEARARDLGIGAVLHKPFDPAELVEAVRAAIPGPN